MAFLPLPHRLATILLLLAVSHAALVVDLLGQNASDQKQDVSAIPAKATRVDALTKKGVVAYLHEETMWLLLDAKAVASQRVAIPRFCAPIRSLHWMGSPDLELKFVPEPAEWVFSWKEFPAVNPAIEIVFDQRPVLPDQCPPAESTGDGSVMLHAYQAATHGEKLRFEPQWYKNTVGYWTVPTDSATWEFVIDQPGVFSVAVLQGCGQGQGGSEAVLTVQRGEMVEAELPLVTIDTGHFQNFRWNHLGHIKIDKSGRHRLTISPVRIAKAALFDVRAIHLVRQAKGTE